MTAIKTLFNTDNIINDYLSMIPLVEICERNGIKRFSLEKLIKERALSRGNPKKIRLNNSEIATAYRSGESEKSIATRYNVGRGVIANALSESGTTRRTISEAEAVKWQTIKLDQNAVIRQCGAAWKASDARNDDLEKQVIALYKEGFSTIEIIDKTGYSRPTIKTIIKKNGLFNGDIANRRAVGRSFALNSAIISPFEIPLLQLLQRQRFEVVHQYALCARNVDIAFPEFRVAVEVERGYFANSKSITSERLEPLFSRGWRVLIVYDNRCIGIDYASVAQQIIAFLERLGLNPAMFGQYGVISCDGKISSTLCDELKDFSRIEGF